MQIIGEKCLVTRKGPAKPPDEPQTSGKAFLAVLCSQIGRLPFIYGRNQLLI
jgi:hypothetical protein